MKEIFLEGILKCPCDNFERKIKFHIGKIL